MVVEGRINAAGFFNLRNWTCFRLWLTNQKSYVRTDGTGGFKALNWSKTDPPRCSDCRLGILYKGVNIQKSLVGILQRDLERFWLYLHYQRSYGQTDATGGFSASNRSKTNLPRCSDCRLGILYKGVNIQERLVGILQRDFGIFLIVSPPPMELWTNGCNWRIQRIKLVWNRPSTLFWL